MRGRYLAAMKFFVDVFEVLVGDVSVNLRGANITVSEHILHAANIGTVH